MDPLGALPAPLAVTHHTGAGFPLGPDVEVSVCHDPAAVGVAVLLAEQLGRATGTPVAVRQDGVVHPGTVTVSLVPVARLALPDRPRPVIAAEAYRLSVGTSVEILAATPAGLCRAVATVVQAVERRLPGPVRLPPVTVVDQPRLAHRGVAVDAVRDRMTPEALKEVVQLAAGLKLDVVRVRLADERTWLLQIPGRPELAVDGTAWTQEAWRDVLGYAAARSVRVVPELDVADHVGWAGPDALGAVAAQMAGGYVHVGGGLAAGADPGVTRALVGMAADEIVAAGATVMVHEDAAEALAGGRAPGHVVEVHGADDDRTFDTDARLVLVVEAPEASSTTDAALLSLLATDPLARGGGQVVGAEVVVRGRSGRGGVPYGTLAGVAAAAEAFWSGPGDTAGSFPERLAAEVERWAAATPLA